MAHQTRDTYRLTFSTDQGRVLVTSFILKKKGEAGHGS